MTIRMTRRQFVKQSAATGFAAAMSEGRRAEANDRVRVGFVGVGNRGGQLLRQTIANPDVEIVALCDVDESILGNRVGELGRHVAQYTDFRRLLDRRDLDGVFIATPDHWHAIQTVMACDAGLDVFVEKPLSLTVVEGRKMVEAARRNRRVVTVGLQRRSSTTFAQLRELILRGAVGKITVARAYRLSNMHPHGIGVASDSEPPEGLDWDLWLGPRAERPFNKNIHPYKFRWWDSYSSQIANWGVHYFDLVRWMLDEEAPCSVSAHGGRFAVHDARTIPDTLHAVFEFASGGLLVFGQYEASGQPMFPPGAEVELRGTQGVVYGGGRGFQVIPERGGQFQDPAPRMEPMTVESADGDVTGRHIRNFLDCIKTRDLPNCDVEEGHRSTVFAHLANIALAARSRIEWDPVAERITNNKEANKLLHYLYREPWSLG